MSPSTIQWAAEAWSKLEFCLCAKTKFSPWLALLHQKNLHIGEAATSKKRRFHFLFKRVVFITLPSAKYALDKVQVRLEKEVLAKLILSVYYFFFSLKKFKLKSWGICLKRIFETLFFACFATQDILIFICSLSYLLQRTLCTFNSLKATGWLKNQVSYLEVSLQQLSKKKTPKCVLDWLLSPRLLQHR